MTPPLFRYSLWRWVTRGSQCAGIEAMQRGSVQARYVCPRSTVLLTRALKAMSKMIGILFLTTAFFCRVLSLKSSLISMQESLEILVVRCRLGGRPQFGYQLGHIFVNSIATKYTHRHAWVRILKNFIHPSDEQLSVLLYVEGITSTCLT